MARQSGVVGDEVAVTASLLDQLPVAPSVVVVVAAGVGTSAFVDEVLFGVRGMLDLEHPVTVGVACPAPVEAGLAGRLSMYNQHADALPEALVEAVAAGRRCGLTTLSGNCVLLVQQFVPAVASAVVHASPVRGTPVRIEGRWGLAEQRSSADTFEVPADGGTVVETLAWKPTASVAAAGGTHTVATPDGWERRNSIGQDTVLQLAAMSRDAAVSAGTPLSLDIVLGDQGPVVVRCRPSARSGLRPSRGGRPSRLGTDV
jgi:hypothetical protein